MRNLAPFVFAALVATGCKWTEFDDLEAETWVSATEKPNDISTDYGIAIQRGSLSSPSGTGGRLVVIGASQTQYTELAYAANGDVELAPTVTELGSQFGVANLDLQPLLIADPTTDEVSLIASSGGDQFAVLHGAGGLTDRQVFGSAQPDAAAYMQAPPRADRPSETQPVQPIIAVGNVVYGGFFTNPPGLSPSTQHDPRCELVDAASAPITIRGVGAARISSTMVDDVVVWTSAGDLLLYPSSVFNGSAPTGSCTDGVGVAPLAGSVAVATGFQPARGSQILRIDDSHVLLVGHKDLGQPESFLAVYDVTAMNATPALEPARIGDANTTPNLRTASYLEFSGGTLERYVVAGYPTATFDGVKAGNVAVYPLSLTAGLGPTAITLHDAQPEPDQQFGRAVAVTQFNGRPVIAVAADNEIFFYFRTQLYAETRDRP